MQNLDLSRTPPQIHASQNPLIPALVPTSLNPQHHSAISFVVSGAASIDYPPTFIIPTPATMLYNYPDQQHYPIGKPPDLGSVKMNDNMAEDSDDSDYLGTSEEEGSGTSDADTSVVNEREMELELEALRPSCSFTLSAVGGNLRKRKPHTHSSQWTTSLSLAVGLSTFGLAVSCFSLDPVDC
ncbi:hypothetical protein WN944_018725 [Citrus x changshan-huyou]|uniref:Uncharacterized protein n=1 Tax=Citrus x changshan-huyou TaxID=2935761 RepID=A0AAP0LUM9_9ROSI